MRTIALVITMAGVLTAASSKEIHRTLPLDPGGRVELTTYKGSIQVSTWERDEVDVSVRIEEDSSWFAQPVSRSDVRLDATRSHVRIESKSDEVPSLFSGSVPRFHYTVRMPRQPPSTP